MNIGDYVRIDSGIYEGREAIIVRRQDETEFDLPQFRLLRFIGSKGQPMQRKSRKGLPPLDLVNLNRFSVVGLPPGFDLVWREDGLPILRKREDPAD